MHLESHLEVDELERRYRAAKEPHERSWWQILWLLAKGQTAAAVAESTGYSRYWIGQLVRRYNEQGPQAMRNRQYTHSHRPALLLSGKQLAELAEAVRGPAPEGGVLARAHGGGVDEPQARSADQHATGLGVFGAPGRHAA
jgi:hypothetical protein